MGEVCAACSEQKSSNWEATIDLIPIAAACGKPAASLPIKTQMIKRPTAIDRQDPMAIEEGLLEAQSIMYKGIGYLKRPVNNALRPTIPENPGD